MDIDEMIEGCTSTQLGLKRTQTAAAVALETIDIIVKEDCERMVACSCVSAQAIWEYSRKNSMDPYEVAAKFTFQIAELLKRQQEAAKNG